MNPEYLRSTRFKALEISFISWLKTLGYSESTVTTRKRSIREFLLYLKRCGIISMDQAARDKTERFVRYLKRRENKLSESGLMNASINVGISSVNKFFEYLLQSGNVTMIPDNLQYMEELYKPRVVLTLQEVNTLYEATYMQKWFTSSQSKEYQGAIQQRDRAML